LVITFLSSSEKFSANDLTKRRFDNSEVLFMYARYGFFNSFPSSAILSMILSSALSSED
jgi:hypothetical protein